MRGRLFGDRRAMTLAVCMRGIEGAILIISTWLWRCSDFLIYHPETGDVTAMPAADQGLRVERLKETIIQHRRCRTIRPLQHPAIKGVRETRESLPALPTRCANRRC